MKQLNRLCIATRVAMCARVYVAKGNLSSNYEDSWHGSVVVQFSCLSGVCIDFLELVPVPPRLPSLPAAFMRRLGREYVE